MSKKVTINELLAQLAIEVEQKNWELAAVMANVLDGRRLNKEQRHELELLQSSIEEQDSGPRGMSSQLNKYKARYHAAISPNGSKSLNNGDDLAQFLEGKDAKEVCRIADDVMGEVPGYHAGKYAKLNLGAQRMNAGNRIRAAVKRGEWKVPS